MITKDEYIKSLVHEIDIIKHLYTKIDASKLDYRPTPKQRSTLELLQYLGQAVHTPISAYIAGNQEKYIELMGNKELVTYENFIQKMDEQAAFVKETGGTLSEEDLKKESTIFGHTASLAMHLLHTLQSVTAYKMQLFLYIKESGNADIGTSNVWAGKDAPVKG
ncbi:MAG TPA: hypothetical protein VGO63_03455 [Candidatus Paceibacterota bacterium]|jgi:hypothetical protein|nr:hypothetical protein [Candidatus Paceibacterota bacterium]